MLRDAAVDDKLDDPRELASVVRSNHRPYPGGLFQYAYKAKWAKQLPYWDAFPLVIVLNLYEDGFLGLNLHYLPPKARAKMFDKLMGFAKDKKTGGHGTRRYIAVSYRFLSGLKNVAGFDFMLKRYLYSQFRSRVFRIHPDNWENVVYLPTQDFQKASAEQVWQDARVHLRHSKRGRK